MVTSFKEAPGDMVMYSFEFDLFFVLYLALDEGKCQNMVRPADCGQVRAASGRWRSCVLVRIGGPEAGVRIWRPRLGDSPEGAVRAGDGNPGLGYRNGIMYGCGRRPERMIHK